MNHRFRKWSILAGVIGVPVFSLVAGSQLLEARGSALRARDSLTAAHRAVEAADVSGAVAHLDAARRHLASTEDHAGAWPLRWLRHVPLVGSPVKALTAGSEAGQEAEAAGRIIAEIAEALLPTATSSLTSDLDRVHAGVRSSGESLLRAEHHLAAARRALEGPAGAVLTPISRPAQAFVAALEEASADIAGTERGLVLTGALTAPGTDLRLLVLAQDTMELRPNGGLVGSFGVLRLSGGRVELERYDDIGTVPAPRPRLVPPDVVIGRAWTLNNSTWWPDFPTSARQAAEMFELGGQGRVDGVIALTENTLARLLKVLGPIKLPGYAAVSHEGFAERVLYEIELKQPRDEPRKKFLIDLATEVFSRLSTLEARQTPGVMRALADSAGAGDIQMWFADEERQNLLKGAAVEGSLPEPDGDFLQLAESNVTASKANLGLTREINYAVSRNDDGRMAAQVTLSYHNDGPDSEVNPYYNGLIRLYVPRGAELVGSTGTISDAPDGPYRVITASVFVPADGGRRTVTFEYLLPDDVVVDGTYRLTVVRQPGTPRDRYTAVIEGRRYDLEPGQRRLEVERDVAA